MSPTSRRAPACPVCGSREVIPIVYGMPSEDDVERAERGEFVLGGCLVGLYEPDPDPSHCCTACGTSFDAASGVIARS